MLLVSLSLGLILVEVVLRVVVPPRTTHCVWPPNMSRVFKPRAELYPDLLRETRFTINSRGLRGPELGRDEDELRVLAIGGSTTEGLYHDDAGVWPARVGALLQEAPGSKRVWVGNAGRSGMNSRDHVMHAGRLLEELPRVDAVVLFVGVNDMIAALGKPEAYTPFPDETDREGQAKAARRAFFQVPGRLEDSGDYERSFFAKSQIFQLVKRVRRQRVRDLNSVYKMQDDNGDNMLRWRENRRQASRILPELPDLAPHLATFRANLNRIADVAKARGTPLVMMTQPTLWRADMSPEEEKLLWMGGLGDFQVEPGHEYYSTAALADGMRRFNEVTLDVCRERGIACIDLAGEIPKDATIFYDDCHFGRKGAERVAQAAAAHLAKQPAFSAPR